MPTIAPQASSNPAIGPSREASRLLMLAVGTACALGLLGAAGRASHRLLWADELFTYYVSQLPVSGIWHALADGIDPHPPLGYLATKLVLNVFGDGLVQARLASLTGFALAVLGIGRFVGRGVGSTAGLVALLVPFVTGAYDYSFEARPYAMELGLSAVALVCWQTTDGPARRRALLGLAAAVAASVSLHYFGGLIVVAIVCGELVRAHGGERRPGVWIALGAGLLPLPALLPLLEAGRGWSGAFWTRPSPGQWLYTYRLFLFPTILPAAITLAAWSVFTLWDRATASSAPAERVGARSRADFAVCLALFLSPTAALAVGYVAGGYHARYAIVMVLGLAGLVGHLLGSERSIRLCHLAAVVLALWVMARGIVSAAPLLSGAPAPDVFTIHPLLASPKLPPSLPIVVSDGATYIELERYAPPALGQRLRAITVPHDPMSGEYYSDTSTRSLEGLARWHSMVFVQYDDLVRRKEPFLAYADAGWLPRRLARDGVRLELIGTTYQNLLILVTPAS